MFDFGATDADGDQLRYSLVTPLAGYTSDAANNRTGNGASRASYPEVNWLPGYGAAAAIPGNPALGIHPQTGELSVTATPAGCGWISGWLPLWNGW